MTFASKRSIALILPYAVWMAMMLLLPPTPECYAARTVAMQTATDNGDKVLQELTLEYNKGRQQKITSEILDLVGGQQES